MYAGNGVKSPVILSLLVWNGPQKIFQCHVFPVRWLKREWTWLNSRISPRPDSADFSHFAYGLILYHRSIFLSVGFPFIIKVFITIERNKIWRNICFNICMFCKNGPFYSKRGQFSNSVTAYWNLWHMDINLKYFLLKMQKWSWILKKVWEKEEKNYNIFFLHISLPI